MPNLPFVVNPRRKPELLRLGNEDVGIIEIERRGYLTTGEKLGYQQIKTNNSGRKALLDLIEAIAKGENTNEEKARALVNKVLDQKKLTKAEEETIEKYGENFLTMFDVFKQEALFTQVMMATILLMSRVDSKITFEDVSALDSLLVEQLAELFEAEEKKSLKNLSFLESEGSKTEAPAGGKSQPEEAAPPF